jgi:hypothetical protein
VQAILSSSIHSLLEYTSQHSANVCNIKHTVCSVVLYLFLLAALLAALPVAIPTCSAAVAAAPASFKAATVAVVVVVTGTALLLPLLLCAAAAVLAPDDVPKNAEYTSEMHSVVAQEFSHGSALTCHTLIHIKMHCIIRIPPHSSVLSSVARTRLIRLTALTHETGKSVTESLVTAQHWELVLVQYCTTTMSTCVTLVYQKNGF